MRAVDITYSIYFGPCIYLSKQTLCWNESALDKEERENKFQYFLSYFFFLNACVTKRNDKQLIRK